MDFDRLAKEFEDFARKDYVIEPPDILLIESGKLLPKGRHRLETFDELQINVKGSRPEQSIDDVYNVDTDGAVNLGPTYGRINVAGQTTKQAAVAIRPQLATILGDADVSVSIARFIEALRRSPDSISSPWTVASILVSMDRSSSLG